MVTAGIGSDLGAAIGIPAYFAPSGDEYYAPGMRVMRMFRVFFGYWWYSPHSNSTANLSRKMLIQPTYRTFSTVSTYLGQEPLT